MSLTALSANVTVLVNWLAECSVGTAFDSPQFASQYKILEQLTFAANGLASEQVNQIYVAERTLTQATGLDDLDLSGALTNWRGDTISFQEIKYILVYNTSATEGADLTIGGTPSAPWSGPFLASSPSEAIAKAGGWWDVGAPFTGFTVTAGSGDKLRIQHPGTAVGDISYIIVILGTE
jgi:hypothetical protein